MSKSDIMILLNGDPKVKDGGSALQLHDWERVLGLRTVTHLRSSHIHVTSCDYSSVHFLI